MSNPPEGEEVKLSPVTMAKIILYAAGIVVWAIGVRTGERTLQLVGLAALVVAFVLRFGRRDRSRD
ncbi:MAG TPA: hypothetical protein VFK13_15155 [Gemmatimonadaceae bacterium]|nr:hypothetical protein [Gemmatimonadaceae bacterium]